ncbi:hypothetical protein PHMEG_000386 [Phytophthora megakarya]|uniref:PA domain-containing protein n=1 Tax=Phytophthora megakarya TaxID=4795 RepID=A0A225X4H0_9STRA|nr:hypothetical protein PHMEG_000386 [Phytophthora megakarya]
MQVNKTREELKFPVLFDAIVNRSVVLEHFSETHELRVRSIEDEKVEVEITTDASTEKSCNNTTKRCAVDTHGTVIDENAVPPPSLQPTDRLLRVDNQEVSVMSFQEVIDSPVGSVAVLPLFKPVGSVHVLSGFARVEILSPNLLEFEPATPTREEVVKAWIEEKARIKAEREAREREIANNKELQARLEQERRVAEALAKKEQELLEKLDKEEFERTRMTPHNLAAGKRRDGWEFRYEVEFTTKGAIGLNWDLNTRDKTVVSHLEPDLPAQKLDVIQPRDQLIALKGWDTSKMGPQRVVEVYLSSAFPRKLVFLVQMSDERAKAKAAEKNPVKRTLMNWTLAFNAPEIFRGWEVRLHLATWSIPPNISATNISNVSSSLPLQLEFATPITGCNQFPEVLQSSTNETAGVVYLAYRGACTLIEKANHARTANGKALLIVNNVKGEGRFTPSPAALVEHVELPVTLYVACLVIYLWSLPLVAANSLVMTTSMGKLDGELIMSVMEHQEILIQVYEERPDQIPVPLEQPTKLTNQELVIARFEILPALFGGKIPTMPFRAVAAYPQETACNYKGLGILATRAVVVVKRGGCSFGTKLRAVQDVGGAGMLLVNSDASLIPLMTDSRELEGLVIWGASINLMNGTAILDVLARSKNLPTLVKIATREEDAANATTSN